MLILYLYSLELGSPPLYAEANRVARDMDLTYLKELGPYVKALGAITFFSEIYKKEKETPGQELGNLRYNMAGSFLLFRGAYMKNEWVLPYIDVIG